MKYDPNMQLMFNFLKKKKIIIIMKGNLPLITLKLFSLTTKTFILLLCCFLKQFLKFSFFLTVIKTDEVKSKTQ